MSITQNLVSRLAFQPLNLKDCTRIRGTECPFVSELGRRRTKPGNYLEYGGQEKKLTFVWVAEKTLTVTVWLQQ